MAIGGFFQCQKNPKPRRSQMRHQVDFHVPLDFSPHQHHHQHIQPALPLRAITSVFAYRNRPNYARFFTILEWHFVHEMDMMCYAYLLTKKCWCWGIKRNRPCSNLHFYLLLYNFEWNHIYFQILVNEFFRITWTTEKIDQHNDQFQF